VYRRQQLALADLFKPNGRYTYSGGVNYRAMVVLILAILPVTPGFLRAALTPGGQVANPTFLDSLYTYAWFVTFSLSFVLYLLQVSLKARTTTVSSSSGLRSADL
jgi:NCS1 family nucleobase:cation symporter-1